MLKQNNMAISNLFKAKNLFLTLAFVFSIFFAFNYSVEALQCRTIQCGGASGNKCIDGFEYCNPSASQTASCQVLPDVYCNSPDYTGTVVPGEYPTSPDQQNCGPTERCSYTDIPPVPVATGTVCVIPNLSSASWSVSGPSNTSGTGSGCTQNMPMGSYYVTGDPQNGYTGPDYNPTSRTLSLSSDGQTITFNLTYTANGSALCQDSQASNYNGPLPCNYNNNVNLYFYVRDLSTQAFISGANVAIVPTANTTTDSSGLASFQVAKNTNVTYTVSKSGCDSSSGSINSGSTGNTANVNLNCASAPPPPGVVLTITVSGSGTVATTYDGSTYSCSSTCSYSMNYGTYVSLVESPGSGSSFSSWAGACSGTSSTCARTISSDTSVTATFTSSGGGSAPVGSISFSINYVLIPNFDYSLSNSGSVSVNKSSGDAYGQSSVSKTLTTGSTQAVDLSISGDRKSVV